MNGCSSRTNNVLVRRRDNATGSVKKEQQSCPTYRTLTNRDRHSQYHKQQGIAAVMKRDTELWSSGCAASQKLSGKPYMSAEVHGKATSSTSHHNGDMLASSVQ